MFDSRTMHDIVPLVFKKWDPLWGPHVKNTRRDYLEFMISQGVATLLEQEEYILEARKEALETWNNIETECNNREAERWQRHLDGIEYNKETVIKLRKYGLFDYAVKYEELILAKEKEITTTLKYYKAFVQGWGTDELYKFEQHEKRMKENPKLKPLPLF